MHEQVAPTLFVRSILVAGLSAWAAGCDHEAPGRAVDIDRHAAQELLEQRDEPTPLTPAEIEAITIEEPTLRDIVEGRVDAPKISSKFGRLGDDGEIVEPCSTHQTESSQGSDGEARDVTFDVQDEDLLDLPIHEACALVDGRSGSVELVRCEGLGEPEASLDGQFDFPFASDPAAERCYVCTWSPVCELAGWNQRQEGVIVSDQCLAWGYAGCC